MTIIILIAILIVNPISFFVYRHMFFAGNLVSLEEIRPSDPDGDIIYFVASMCSQPATAFEHYIDAVDDMDDECGIVYVNFRPFGWNPLDAYRAIYAHAESNGCTDPAIVALSLGAQVLNHLSYDEAEDCMACLVNPCGGWKHLAPRWRVLLPVLAILLAGVRFILGWLGAIPFGRARVSLSLLVDQAWHLCFDELPAHPCWVDGNLIASSHDQFVDVEATKRHYSYCDIVNIDTPHGALADDQYSGLYVQAAFAV